MVESGFTRAKNAVNILMKNLMDFSMGSIAYWAVGFAIMFGTGSAFMGLSGWFVPADSTAFASLEMEFCPDLRRVALPIGIRRYRCDNRLPGAMAERTQFKSYLIYSVFITGFIYPIVGHWIWGGGWLANFGAGMLDFCGFNGRSFNGRLACSDGCYRLRSPCG